MNNTLLKQILIRHEGRITKVYKDTLNLKTAGVGHLLLGADRDLEVGTAVSDKQIDTWFENDISRSIWIAKSLIPELDSLDDVRQVVLVSLCFNMGNRVANFQKMLTAVHLKRWDEAAAQLQDSTWFKQVGHRGPELVEGLRTGAFGFL